MFGAESVKHDAMQGEPALDSVNVLPLAHTDSRDIFGAFLHEFTGGTWTAPDDSDLRSVSRSDHEEHGCQRYWSKELALDASTSVVTGENSSSSDVPTAQSDSLCPRPSGIMASCCNLSSNFNEESTADAASVFPDGLATKCIISYSSVRKLTNATYARRMHMSKEDVLHFFPKVRRTVDFVFKARMAGRDSSRPLKIGTYVCIQDGKGRRWQVMLECLRTAGQRHLRLNKGWAELCSANGLTVGKCLRLDRWVNAMSSTSEDALVTVSLA